MGSIMNEETEQNIEMLFPPRPEEPQESDCCGSGCSPCVFDIYRMQLAEWEKQCNEIICNQGCRSDTVSEGDELPLSQVEFKPFQLVSVKQHTYDTYIYVFQAVKFSLKQDLNRDDLDYVHIKRALNIKTGQHLFMRSSSSNNDESKVTRAYTPISSSNGHFEVLIKLYKDGKMSGFIQNLKESDIVEWRGPCGNFQYTPNSYKHLLMFCAGTGIAPMYSIAKSIVEDDSEDTFVRLMFACKSFEDILLRNELQQLALYWNFSAEIYLSRVESETVEVQARYGENVRKGRMDKDVMNAELAGKKLEEVYVLICGTKSFAKDMINFVKQAGLPDSNIYLF